MTDHKYTDEEVIRALGCCNDNISKGCDDCPFDGVGYEYDCSCVDKLNEATIDLINRQRAEIESLSQNNISTKYPNCVLCSKGVIFTKSLEDYDKLIGDISADAVKEFAERLKQNLDISVCGYSSEEVTYTVELTIDNLVKEFTEDEKSCPDCKYFVGCETACGGVPCDLYEKGEKK